MAQHRPDDPGAVSGDPSGLPVDPAAVAADDARLDELGTARIADDTEDTFRLLAAQRREVHTDADRELIDTDTALAAMSVDPPVAAAVALIVCVAGLFGAGLGIALAYAVGFTTATVTAVVLMVAGTVLAVGGLVHLGRCP